MFSGGPPYHLMWSSMFNRDQQVRHKPTDWRRIYGLFKKYWREQCQLLVAIFVSSIFGLLPALFTKSIIDRAIPHHDFTLLAWYVLAMIFCAVAAALLGVYQGYLNSFIGEGIIRDIRTELVTHLHRMPLSFFAGTKTGEIMNRVSNDIESIDNVLTNTLVTIVTNLFVILTSIVAIAALDWRLAITSLLVIPLMILPMWPVGRRMYEVRKVSRERRDDMESLTQETLSISGITLIKSFNREVLERERFRLESTALMVQEIKLAMMNRWFMMLVTAMVVIGPALVWLCGGWLAIFQGLTVGTIVTVIALLARMYTPAAALAGFQVQLVGALAVFERIFDYLDMEGERDDPEAVELPVIAGEIAFDAVSFAYSESRTALRDVKLQIKPGQLAAFVGHSGAGKTTITQLVARFYEPQSGSITLDGIEIKKIKLHSLRSHIGMVTQETYLFHDTIENNLRYARPNLTDDEIVAACRAANIHDFICTLPDGYKTTVGERGHKLSGGERQRLAIARVLLKNPKILILDEATSSLDSHNEAQIQAALAKLLQNRTSLVIAHRLSTILAADIIFVLRNGQIVESGKHNELLAKNSYYAELYLEQFKDVTDLMETDQRAHDAEREEEIAMFTQGLGDTANF
jgi:ATP-binding cassette subfamily B protein